MPMQEFLASYAVQVDEDGARRLQSILKENRESGAELAAVFESARSALNALKKELSDANGLKNVLQVITSGSVGSARFSSSALSSLRSTSLSDAGSASSYALSGSRSILSVAADFSTADEALADFRTRMEAERPRLSVNTSGITSAVSSAIASIRSMMSSVKITVPVTATASLDTKNLKTDSSSNSSSGSTSTSARASTSTIASYGTGGRVSVPTLAMIAEEGEPEYVIPTANESRAVPLLRSLLSELSSSARSAVLGASAGNSLSTSLADLSSAARASFLPVSASSPRPAQTVQAPVNIHVTTGNASPEAVGQSIYDTAQRSLLKTLKGVFA